ncbi:MAG: hypothetical protein K2Y35_20485 [Burkholderiales bacterium]|nr:hypothetical protein [Burkholderiales bacterium]
MRTSALFIAVVIATAVAGCSSRKDVVEQYQRDAKTSEAESRSADAEAFHRSAAERAQELGPAEQSESLLGLGVQLQTQQRFKESLVPLSDSLAKAQEAGMAPTALAVRQVRLAQSYAALNRWKDGAAFLKPAVPAAKTLTGEDGRHARDIMDVYRMRLPQLGLDAGFLE